MFNYYNPYADRHVYTFVVEGIKAKDGIYASRAAANDAMYSFISKHDLQLDKVYDDKHDKTYIFTNGVRIHINRA